MDSDRFRDLAISQLLGELAGAELREFRSELERRGPDGDREVARLRESLGSLALAAPAAEPPAGLRERLLAEVRADASHEADAGRRADKPVDLPVETAAPSPESEAARVIPLRSRAGVWAGAAAGLAATLALVFGIGNLGLRERVANLETSLDSATAALAAADAQLAAADSARRELERTESALDIAAARGATGVMLSGTEAEPLAWARAFIDPASGRALLLVYDLPVLPPDAVYQLWAIRDGTPASAGTLTVDADGTGRLESEEADLWIGASVLAVTVEPAPGQPAPTGPIVLAGSI